MRALRLLPIWILLVVAAHVLPGYLVRRSAADMPTKSPRTLTYAIDAALDPALHEVNATGTLTWRNDASGPATEMRLHLYLNAFHDHDSTWMKERDRREDDDIDPRQAGSIRVTSFREGDGPERIEAASFVSPDDENAKDRTVLRIPLEKPVEPGAEATFHLAWTSRLPKAVARSGWGGDFHMAAQWFPKPGVFQDCGGGAPSWNCHQYHAAGEFFADYGVYRLRVTVPAAYRGKVGASGRMLGETANADGTFTYEFLAEDVHDVAFVADPDFVVHEFDFEGGAGTAGDDGMRRVAGLLGREPSAIATTPVRVRLMLQPDSEPLAGRYERAVRNALTWMGLWFGPYPYPYLTVVDPDRRAPAAGGMEYPTLFMAWHVPDAAARDLNGLEGTVIHEFGHQHFYGLVGTNEFEDAWMDEGMTTFATAKTMHEAYPPQPPTERFAGFTLYRSEPLEWHGWLDGFTKALGRYAPGIAKQEVAWGKVPPIGSIARALGVDPPDRVSLWPEFGEVSALAFLRDVPPLTHLAPLPQEPREREREWNARSPFLDPIAGRPVWQYAERRSQTINAYGRPAAALRTLEGILGEPTFLRAMRTYTERYRFQHPTPDQFFAVADEVAKAEGKGSIQWYFDEVFRGAGRVDYAVERIRSEEPEKDGTVESVVELRRPGEIVLPVPFRVRFDDGTTATYVWERDGSVHAAATPSGTPPPPEAEVLPKPSGRQEPWAKVTLRAKSAVEAAEIDPDRTLWLDVDRTNDGKRREPAGHPSLRLSVRLLGWLEMNSSFYGGL